MLLSIRGDQPYRCGELTTNVSWLEMISDLWKVISTPFASSRRYRPSYRVFAPETSVIAPISSISLDSPLD